jgi:opacity protein-like surface antigen
MKVFQYLCLMVSLLICSSESNASTGVFAVLDGGVSYAEKFKDKEGRDDYFNKRPRSAPVYKAKVGYRFNEYLRTYVSVAQIGQHKFTHVQDSGEVNSQKVSSTVGMLNVNYDLVFARLKDFTPYLTLGVGAARNKAGNYDVSSLGYISGKKKTNFAWTVGLGGNFDITKTFFMDLSYQYYDLGKVTTSNQALINGNVGGTDPVKTKFKTNAFTMGLGMNF